MASFTALPSIVLKLICFSEEAREKAVEQAQIAKAAQKDAEQKSKRASKYSAIFYHRFSSYQGGK